ncbi:peptidylprolyl isomerase [Candidatus Pelagadaptatus aseana]|uniref:peptidylprolyl isomerase n=1 Tax=Candidatus Pelagadaptatus aseana TaxID=3120508 RepID=UPI003C70128E
MTMMLFSLNTLADNPRLTLTTDLGDITLELYPERAPQTVANFLQYVEDGFYIGTIFHRVIPGFVAQGGGLTFDFVKKKTRDPVINESINGLANHKGTVAMARLPHPDSATSQFFINLEDNPHLNAKGDKPGYTVFAKVVNGMDTVTKITQEPQGRFRPQAPDTPVRILSIQYPKD